MPYIKSLLKQVEIYYGRVIKTTVHFEALSAVVEHQTNERISSSTLKRLWGYVRDRHEPRIYTLDVLSKYIGYRNFEHFCEVQRSNPDNNSNFFEAFTLSSEDLKIGDRIEIGWSPNRYLILKYLGSSNFIVESSDNSKLLVNDEFSVNSFILAYPLYLSGIIRDNKVLPSYVAGVKGGLTILSMI